MPYYKVPTTNKVIQMLNRRGRLERVIDLVSSLPFTPAEGDRYIDLNDNKVKEWDGSVWQEYVPKEGDNLYVLNRDKYYFFDGINWKDVTEISSYWEEDGDTLKPINVSNVEITGSFIGDGSQLTGIKKLIEEFVAQGNVTAGDVVAFVNGKVKKGKESSGKDISGFSDKYLFNNDKTTYISASLLSNTKFVVVYKDYATDKTTSLIGEVVNDNEIVFGNEYTLDIMIGSYCVVSALSENKFVVVGSNSSAYGVAIIGEVVNDNEIVFGNEYVFHTTYTFDIVVSALSDDSFVVGFENNEVGNYYGAVIIGEVVNDNEIVFGNEYVFAEPNNSSIGGIYLEKLSNSKFLISYGRDGYGYILVANIVNNEVVFGSEYNLGEGMINGFAVFSDIKFVGIIKRKNSNNNYYGAVIIGEVVNDNEIVFGNEYVFTENEDLSLDYRSIDILSENKFVIVYGYYTGSSCVKVGEVVNDNEIVFGNEYVFDDLEGLYLSVLAISNTKFVVLYEDTGNNYYGVAVIGQIVSEFVFYIGISQETKSDGETTKVLVQGISDVHSGLEVGKKYYATPEGDLTTEPTEDYLGIAIAEDKLLLMDWQRPATLYDEDSDEFLMSDSV